MLEYMMQNGSQFANSIESFAREAGITDTSDFGKNILEKKWTSIVRMQKRVMELEAQVSELQKRGTNLSGGLPDSDGDGKSGGGSAGSVCACRGVGTVA